jgi:hypothetical protein
MTVKTGLTGLTHSHRACPIFGGLAYPFSRAVSNLRLPHPCAFCKDGEGRGKAFPFLGFSRAEAPVRRPWLLDYEKLIPQAAASLTGTGPASP